MIGAAIVATTGQLSVSMNIYVSEQWTDHGGSPYEEAQWCQEIF
jgi:hypothetical protein